MHIGLLAVGGPVVLSSLKVEVVEVAGLIWVRPAEA